MSITKRKLSAVTRKVQEARNAGPITLGPPVPQIAPAPAEAGFATHAAPAAASETAAGATSATEASSAGDHYSAPVATPPPPLEAPTPSGIEEGTPAIATQVDVLEETAPATSARIELAIEPVRVVSQPEALEPIRPAKPKAKRTAWQGAGTATGTNRESATAENAWHERYRPKPKKNRKARAAAQPHQSAIVYVMPELKKDLKRVVDRFEDEPALGERALPNSRVVTVAIEELLEEIDDAHASPDLLARLRRPRDYETRRIGYSMPRAFASHIDDVIKKMNDARPRGARMVMLTHLAEVALENLVPRLLVPSVDPDLVARLRRGTTSGV